MHFTLVFAFAFTFPCIWAFVCFYVSQSRFFVVAFLRCVCGATFAFIDVLSCAVFPLSTYSRCAVFPLSTYSRCAVFPLSTYSRCAVFPLSTYSSCRYDCELRGVSNVCSTHELLSVFFAVVPSCPLFVALSTHVSLSPFQIRGSIAKLASSSQGCGNSRYVLLSHYSHLSFSFVPPFADTRAYCKACKQQPGLWKQSQLSHPTQCSAETLLTLPFSTEASSRFLVRCGTVDQYI
jgi:hypothetical protein